MFNESTEVDTSLVFLPGNHFLNLSLLIDDSNSFIMDVLGNSSDNVTIKCTQPRNFNFQVRNVMNVYINGLQFVGCISSLSYVEHVLITGCTFSFSIKSALTIVEASAYIVKSSFSYNEGSSYQFELKRLVGGAITARQSGVTIVNSIFQRNTAENGGAIYCHSKEKRHFKILNSIFTENAVKCNFTKEIYTCYGGVLYSQGCNVLINDSIFQNNSALHAGIFYGRYGQQRGSYGGVLGLFSSSASIHQSSFTHNRAAERGGVIFMKKSDITSAKNNFYRNNASRGGVIWGSTSNFRDSQSNFSRNIATGEAGVLFCSSISSKYCVITFIKSTISLNNATNGRVVDVIHGRVSIVESMVISNFDSVVFGRNTRINITRSEFINNVVNHDAIIHLFEPVLVAIIESNFTNNVVSRGRGAVMQLLDKDADTVTVAVIKGSRFSNNAIRSGDGGVISCEILNIIIVDCQFESNIAGSKGGVLSTGITHNSLNINNCTFYNNSAHEGGTIHARSTQTISISQSEFKANRASVGAIMFLADVSTVKMKDLVICQNVASLWGALFLTECTVTLSGKTKFSENLGSLLAYGSTVNITGHTKVSESSQNSDSTFQEGGAVTAFQSEIMCNGECTLSNNSAKYGGAIHATESKLYFNGKILIVGNQAANNGGGIYLQQSVLICNNTNITLLGNTAVKGGGGIYAVGSSIKLDFHFLNNGLQPNTYAYTGSLLALSKNRAKEGGGLYLESSAKLYILKKETRVIYRPNNIYERSPLVKDIQALKFASNVADYGGAVYVADDTYFATCGNVPNKLHSTSTECFFQILLLANGSLTIEEESVYLKSYLRFEKNFAHISGSTLYGGLLDRCTVSPFANTFSEEINTLSFFTDMNNTEISSDPVRVCFCRNNQPDCGYQPLPIEIEKGKKFNLTIAAVDQVNHTLRNVTIRSSLLSKFGGLGENQLSQITNNTCTDLHYEIFSPNVSEHLIMYADGPCKDALPSQRRLKIHFSPCSCLLGFQPSLNPSQATRCTCECDPQLDKYITDCNPQTGDLMRKGSYWIAYLNTSNQYLAYPNCPLDYCLPESSQILFNLNTQDGADLQCTNNHSGKLCGPCKPGFSLSLGSSRCILCPKYWPALLIAILAAALMGGILLIAAILTFNLTVAVGTLNGIIFYANIVHANASVFLPFRKTNFITVFIAWLNLELGFDVCFFEYMNAFWKTLLQLTFPIYLITLLVIIILVSERYTWFARLFEKRNPVATLATLVLISYVKLLHAIIASFSFIILKYPNGSKEIVWLPDATVSYFKRRHICLFFIAFIVLLAGVAYTVLLFSWQWLLRCKNKMLTKLITYHKLYMFLEPYHAPYNYKHRYWTGLLLLVRAVLYVVSAVNVSHDPEVNLLAVAVAMTGLLLLKGFINKNIYKNWKLDVLEMICYINLLCFCLAMFFALAGNRDGTVIAYISGSLIVLMFAIVLYVQILSKSVMRLCIWSKCKQRMQQREELHKAELKADHQLEVTYSEVAALVCNDSDLELTEMALSDLPEDQDKCKDDNSESDNTVSYHLMK